MPVTINGLPEQSVGDVDDTDFYLLYDASEPTNKSKEVTRANMLKDVAREGGDHDFGTSEITSLTAGIDTLTFASTAALTNVLKVQGSVTVSALGAGAAETKTVTMSGLLTTDYLMRPTFLVAIDDRISYQAWISAANTVSIRFRNNSTGAATGGTYNVRIVAFRFA